MKKDDLATTIEALYQLGNAYFLGSNGKPQNYKEAKVCFLGTLGLNPKHRDAAFYLGLIYRYGMDTDEDLEKAIFYYEKAAEQGCSVSYNSLKELFKHENPGFTVAQDWCDLGEDYYHGDGGKVKSFIKARICHGIALDLNENHGYSLYRLGSLYQYAQGVSENLSNTKSYYKKSVEQGFNCEMQQVKDKQKNFIKDSKALGKQWGDEAGDWTVSTIGSFLGKQLLSKFLDTGKESAIIQTSLLAAGFAGRVIIQAIEKHAGNPVKNKVSSWGKNIVEKSAPLVTMVIPSYFFKPEIVNGTINNTTTSQPVTPGNK